MAKVNINLGENQAIALSQVRLNAVLEGNQQALQKMGWFDTLKDKVFQGGSKQAALTKLAAEFDASKGLSAVDRFIKLSGFANPIDRSQFSLSIGGQSDAPTATFRIRDSVIKVDHVSPEALNALEARLGLVDGFKGAESAREADWLGQYERQNLRSERQLLDDSAFKEGGVHKRFHPGSGILRAEDKTGAADFHRELAIAARAEENPDLNRYVSTQKAIPADQMAEILPNIRSDKPHATVTLYDPSHVKSGELDREIGSLTPTEARSVLIQTVDLARVLYKNQISHQDLHMHNLMVYKPLNPGQGNITLKAIDFGKSKTGIATESDRLNDVRYLFHKKASSGELETLGRNMRDALGYAQDKQAKHYPLHKLLVRCASATIRSDASAPKDAYDRLLSGIGDRLIQRLQAAEDLAGDERSAAIDQAFDEAMASLALTAENLSRPVIQPHFIRG